jgi:hypothetical protein
MRYLLLIIVLIFVCAVNARATVVMDWAPIGYAGNAGDPIDPSFAPSSITFGAVNYNYQISKYDVTDNQYVEFLNAKDPTGGNALGLYAVPVKGHGGIAFDPTAANGSKYSVVSGRENFPINAVSSYSAMRFTNWLNNGQGNADTETGAYTLLGGTPVPSNAGSISRDPSAHIVLPTENEWYKAAYYNPATSTYFAYPGSNSLPTPSAPPGVANSANYSQQVGFLGDLTKVGAYSSSPSSFGTFDQFGDVAQWLDPQGTDSTVRGWSYDLGNSEFAHADYPVTLIFQGLGVTPASVLPEIGFRVAMVPEPSSVTLAAFGLVGLAAWGWRRRT